jgi:hypothetical protein
MSKKDYTVISAVAVAAGAIVIATAAFGAY